MANIDSGQPVRSLVDGPDERLQTKIVGHASNSALNQLAQYQQLVDSDGNAHVLAEGHDSAGATHPILTDTQGRPRVVIEEASTGTDVSVYNLSSAAVKNVPVTHTYTVTALKTLTLRAIHCGASGAAHYEIKTGVAASETTRMWVFLTASSSNYRLEFKNPIQLPAGQNVLVIKTNKENQVQDLHDLIEGDEA